MAVESAFNYANGMSQIRFYCTILYDIMKEFHEKYDVSINLLLYYIRKWHSFGMINYDVNLLFGWFELGTKTPIRYVVLMPDRIFKKLCNNGVNFPTLRKER